MCRPLLILLHVIIVALLTQSSWAVTEEKFGNRMQNDTRIGERHLEVESGDFRHYFQTAMTGDGYATITELKIIPKKSDCGTVVPVNGGPGSSFVVLQVDLPSHCYSYIDIEIYGRNKTSCECL